MNTAESRTVFKYFPRADRFVRIRVGDAGSLGIRVGPGHDLAGYQREVVRACVELEHDEDLDEIFDAAAQEGSAVLAELYGLVVGVNPELDINRLSLADRTAERRPKARKESLRAQLRRRLRGFEARLAERVVGQEEAIACLARAARRAAAGLNEERGPLASLLFVGPTGTGKTELARALADELGGAQRLIRVDCSELAEAHETSRLVGAPPGYVGHGEGGFLTERVAAEPRSVVLFDEVEKAHPRMHDLLLQILEEGCLTDGASRRVSFSQAFVVLTSNCGSDELAHAAQRFGFHGGSSSQAVRSEVTRRALEGSFSPEFLGRLDETVVFRDLDRGDALRIAEAQLTELAVRVRRRGQRVRFTRAVAGWVVRHGFSAQSGARSIRHVIRRDIEAPLADELLRASAGPGVWAQVSVRGGAPHVRIGS